MEDSFDDDVRQNAGRAERWLVQHADALSLILIALGVLRIVITLTVFSSTSDEPNHVTAGLELLTRHRYGWQLENPPLPRVVFAYPLWRFGGGAFDPNLGFTGQLMSVFHERGQYVRSLFLARIGNVLFFIVAALAMWRWTRRELGRATAAMATFLFTTQPILLGYTAIANFDAACVAGFAVAMLAFSRWLDRPTVARALVFGAAYGLAIGLKFTNIPFVPVACVAMFVVDADIRRVWRRVAAQLPLAALATLFVVWANYAFTFGTFAEYGLPKPAPITIVGRLLAPLDASTPVPAPHFLVGLAGIFQIDQAGHLSYALGQRTTNGWWWYFPLAVLLKTTLASLLLFLAGLVLRRRDRFVIGSALAVAAILAVGATSKLDLGVRYVLPLYVPLTAIAAAAAMTMLRHAKKAVRVAAIVLLVWHTGASLLAHPDYFPYFNELALPEPSRYLIDSNLDWGQDVLRLKKAIEQEHVTNLGVALVGVHDFKRLGFPPTYPLDGMTPTQGWAAISEHVYRIMRPDGDWRWLSGRPYKRIGKSIRLYYIP